MFTPNPYIALACTLALGTLERGSFHLIHNVQATENTLAYKDICEYDCSEHGTVRKIDIFKLTCKVLSCVGVGLIKKTLAWYQIMCIPNSTNPKILYQTSCVSARWSASSANHHIWHTGTWLINFSVFGP